MLGALLLLAQVAATDSTYPTLALRRFVAEAAAAAAIPADLAGYQARLESDIALLRTDIDGREHATQLEQVESGLAWGRDGRLLQHVIGYRSQGGLTVSALSLLRTPWVLPTLYGDELRLLLHAPVLEGGGPAGATAVHPLAAGRDSFYRFSGGDTALVVQLTGRSIALVRVHVEPRSAREGEPLVFRGDLLIDADSKQIVEMRGELGQARSPSWLGRVASAGLERSVFVEVRESEFEGRFWLPTYQRVDVQLRSDLSADFRPGFRIVTRFAETRVDTVGDGPAWQPPRLDPAPRSALTFAPGDSLEGFRGWLAEIGRDATEATASDFDDVGAAPETRAARRLEWRAERLSDVFRYDKVEGAYTGVAGTLRPATGSPGVSLAGHVGWAWGESRLRGAVALRRDRGSWRTEVEAQREVVNTNDFLPPLEGPATLSALFTTVDDFDYVGRSSVEARITRAWGPARSRQLTLRVGPTKDSPPRDHVSRGLIVIDSTFRPNRAVAEGSYLGSAASFALNPGVSGEFLEPGVGFGLSYQRGDGGLRWQRVDGELTARHTVGRFSYYGRVDGAALFGGSPPQRIIEFGENEGMPGYGYKSFGGDRAAIGRAGVVYVLPFLSAPVRLRRWLALPGPSPAFTLQVQAGWAGAVDAETARALASFGYTAGAGGQPVLRTGPTSGVRSSLALSLDFFGGALGLGVAHRLERGGRWVFILGSQQW